MNFILTQRNIFCSLCTFFIIWNIFQACFHAKKNNKASFRTFERCSQSKIFQIEQNFPREQKCASEQKMCHRTKNIQGNSNCAKGTNNVPISQNEDRKGHMGAKCNLLWHIKVLNYCVCLVWPSMALYDLVWPPMVLLLLFTTISMCGSLLSMPSVT